MPAVKKLWMAAAETAPEAAEIVADILGEKAAALTILSPPRAGKARIEALYQEEPDRAALTSQILVATTLNGLRAPKLEVQETPSFDWLKKVAEDFPPFRTAGWTIHGAGHRHSVPDRRLALQIDASSAFGTGEHPTTRGCLVMLDWLLKREQPRRMLDMGCGSGILAMAYAKTTHGRAVGVDLDPDSVLIAQENIRANGLQKEVRVALGRGYTSALVKSNAPYDLIMANIFAGPLSQMAADLRRHLKPGGTAILAGLLNAQANRVLAAHRAQGLYLAKRLVIGEWSILALRRPGGAKCRQ